MLDMTRAVSRARERLSRERIIDAAISIADRDGLESLSMRRLAADLGVDPMSLYHHVGDKDGLLAAMTDAVISRIPQPGPDPDWATALRTALLDARATMLAHPWTPAAVARLPGPTPAGLRHLDGVLGILRAAGFPLALIHHAIHAFGSRLLGFSQDLYDDGTRPEPDEAALQARRWADSLPTLAALVGVGTHDGGLGGCDDDEEFRFAVDLIIEGLERRFLGTAG